MNLIEKVNALQYNIQLMNASTLIYKVLIYIHTVYTIKYMKEYSMLGGYAVIESKTALINKTQMNLFQINFFGILIDELKTSLVVIVI